MTEFSDRLSIREDPEEAARLRRIRIMFARMNPDKPKPPITDNMGDHYALWKVREQRRETRHHKEQED